MSKQQPPLTQSLATALSPLSSRPPLAHPRACRVPAAVASASGVLRAEAMLLRLRHRVQDCRRRLPPGQHRPFSSPDHQGQGAWRSPTRFSRGSRRSPARFSAGRTHLAVGAGRPPSRAGRGWTGRQGARRTRRPSRAPGQRGR